MALSRGTIGSLGSAGDGRLPARPRPLVALPRSQSRHHMPVRSQAGVVRRRCPLCAFVTLWKAAVPAKLSTCHRPPAPTPAGAGHGGQRRVPERGGISRTASRRLAAPSTAGLRPPSRPTYAASFRARLDDTRKSRFIGSSRLTPPWTHLHVHFNFTGELAETAPESLRLSCRTIISGQGISLP